MKNCEDRFRFDLIQRDLKYNEEDNTISGIIEPDPRRYEWVDKEDGRYLFDRLDNLMFPRKLFMNMIKKAMENMPVQNYQQKIGNAYDYYEKRKPIVKKMINDGNIPEKSEDKSESFLRSLEKDNLNFVIVSLDIVGSTNLSLSIDPKKYAFLISLVLYELSEIVPQFHGHVLKYTGDGLIAYFPEPSLTSKNDLALDCSLTMRGMIYQVLNNEFAIYDYPKLDIRIGLAAGNAYVQTMGSPKTKQHKDIIGFVVSLAAKIESVAEVGSIYLGQTVERNLHFVWRKKCELVENIDKWNYKDNSGNIYKIYRYM